MSAFAKFDGAKQVNNARSVSSGPGGVPIQLDAQLPIPDAVSNALSDVLDGHWRSKDWREATPVQTASDVSTPVAGTGALLNYVALVNQSHCIEGIDYSYDGAPTSGNLQVHSPSGTVILNRDITAAGPASIDFTEEPLRGARGAAMLVYLAPAGASVKAKVNAKGHHTE